MILSPMRFKDFVWPHNPVVYSISYERKMAVNKTPFGLFHLQNLGRTNRIMAGEGEFIGEDAYRQFGQLASVFYEDSAGELVHPLWQTSNAYFVSLRLEQEPRPDYVRYSFVFWEDDSPYTGLTVPVKEIGTQTGNGQSNTVATGNQSNGLTHRVVKGDTLWGIGKTYGVSVSDLIALNPQIKNPNLI